MKAGQTVSPGKTGSQSVSVSVSVSGGDGAPLLASGAPPLSQVQAGLQCSVCKNPGQPAVAACSGRFQGANDGNDVKPTGYTPPTHTHTHTHTRARAHSPVVIFLPCCVLRHRNIPAARRDTPILTSLARAPFFSYRDCGVMLCHSCMVPFNFTGACQPLCALPAKVGP